MENIVKNEFLFYSKLAKPLILNLPKSTDRIRAAAWIKKFMDEASGDERLRTTYLKLLLFCLQRRTLTGIFSDDPAMYDVLEELPIEYDLNELARNLLEQERVERKEKIKLEMMGDMPLFPAYTTDCSPDLTEYVAAQDIPNFGVHAYYAISKQPINKWQKADKAILPKGTKSAIDTSITAAAVQLDASCVCAPKSAASAPEVEDAPADGDQPDCKKKKDQEPERKKRRSRKMGQSPPTHPIGEVHHKVEEEERPTPTWGTNLLEVKELTDVGKVDEPTEVQIQLEKEVSQLMEEEEGEGDEDEEDPTSSKADDMLHIIDEWKEEKLDKTKKMPSRLAKLGDRSGIKAPKSTRAPKIAVKGMKKGKGKGKDKFGPKPDNLPEEYEDWTEKDLEEAGLTWADLMPVDDDIDAELQRIEDEAMAGLDDDDFAVDEPFNPYEDLTDYDAMLREAEEDLAKHKTMYDTGLEEDEPVVDLFDDEMEDLADELNLSRAAEEVQTASPALTEGIPVTTPRRSPTPRRSKSPEKSFAEEDDVLLKPRVSPLRAPKEDPSKKKKSGLPVFKSRLPAPKSVSIKDPNISKVYESARAAIDKSFGKRKKEQDESTQDRSRSPMSSTRRPTPPASPCGGQGAMQSPQQQQQQQQQLRTPPRPAPDPAYLQFASEFPEAEGGLDDECIPCSPSSRDSPQLYSPTSGQALPIPEFNYGPDDVDSPTRFDYMKRPEPTTPDFIRHHRNLQQMPAEEFDFDITNRNLQENIAEEQPCQTCNSPPPMTEDEEFEFLERMYNSPSQRNQQVLSPTTGAVFPIPEFNYGPQDVDDPNRFDYMKRPRPTTPEDVKAFQREYGGRPLTPPPPPSPVKLPSQQDEVLQKIALMTRAYEQEMRLRQGSPEAADIIQEAQTELGRQLRVGYDKMIEESPPLGVKTPPKKAQLPPRPLFSPTTGNILPIPEFDIAPEQLGMSWEDGEEIPEFEPSRRMDYLYNKTAQEREEQDWQAQTDIFERCGDTCLAAADNENEQSIMPQKYPPVSPPVIRPIQWTRDASPCGSPTAPSPQTPLYQLPAERPLRYESPYTPPPRTPQMQGPEQRPCGYRSPFEPGVSSPRTPPWQYPVDIFKGAPSPPSDLFDQSGISPLPMEAYFDPLDYVGMGLSDVEGLEDDILPFESPEPCTPCGARDMPAPSMRPPAGRPPPEPSYVPLGADGRPLVAKRLFTGEDSTEARRPIGQPQSRGQISRLPTGRQIQSKIPSRGQIPSKIPSRGQIPSKIPSRGQIPSKIPSRGQIPSKIPSRGQIPSRIPSAGQGASRIPPPGAQRPPSRAGPPPPRRQMPEPQQYMGTPQAQMPIEQRGLRQPAVGTPTRQLLDRPRRRLFETEDEDEGGESSCGVCGKPEPSMRESAARRSPKHMTPPPYQPPSGRSPYLTPEGQPGPSRRPTGSTPDGYNSDFEEPPPLPTPEGPKFPPARRIKKGSRPATPTDQRRVPSPCMARAPRMLSRTFGGPVDRPRQQSDEPPVVFSPMEPFVPDIDTWVPPPPKYYKDPMYFPPEVMDTDTPADYPTMAELKQHRMPYDTSHVCTSRYKGPTAGTGRFTYRDSRQVRDDKERDVPLDRRMENIPEFEDYGDWLHDTVHRKDIDFMDYVGKPNVEPQSSRKPYKPQCPMINRSPVATEDTGHRYNAFKRWEVEEDSEEISGYEDMFEKMLQANIEVPPEKYPQPQWERGAPCSRQVRRDMERTQAFLDAERRPPRDAGQKHLMEIADEFTDGGLNVTPPDQIGGNYYPDILHGIDQLGRTLTQYGLPESPLPSPFRGPPGTPPIPRAPSSQQPPPSRGGTCGAGGAVSQKRSQPRIPKPKQLRETKSSQLRKATQAKKQQYERTGENLSPTSRMLKKRREKAAKANEDKKKQLAAKKQAAEEAKRAETAARIAEGLPGGKMRPLDYREAKGSGRAPLSSAKKAPTRDVEDHEGARARRKLFGSQPPGGARQTEDDGRDLRGRKRKGRKGPGAPCQGRGPEFMDELREHEVNFPRRQMGVVVGGGKYKKLPRRSDQAFNVMEDIGEEERSPCGTCSGGEDEEEDDYQAALRELGITAEQAAETFNAGFLDELEEIEEEEPGSPNAIRQLEAQLRDMDEYEKQQAEFLREIASDMTDEELREAGITRAELERPAPCRPCRGDDAGSSRRPKKKQVSQQQQQMLAQLQELEERAEQIAGPSEYDLAEQAVLQREQEEREMFERMMGRGQEDQTPVRSPTGSPCGSCGGSPQQAPPQRIQTEEEEQFEFEELERQMADQDQGCPGARSPQAMPQLYDAALQQESMAKKRLIEQQLQTQGGPIRGRAFPASGINYSPPRPQGVFGPAPYPQAAGRLPVSTPPRASPPRYPTPPGRCPASPEIPAFSSPPPPPPGVLEMTPPFMDYMEEEDRIQGCRPPVPRWSPTPPPPRAPSPPPFIPTPPSPPLIPQEVRQQVASMARPEFDPANRRDILQRGGRCAFKAPSVGLYNVQEEEPLIPEFAGDESFMGWPVVPGERAPKKRRRYYKDKKAKRLFEKSSETSKLCRRIEKKFPDLPPLPPDFMPEEDYILDDSLPDDLPAPIAAGCRNEECADTSPQYQRLPLEPVELAPWEGTGFRQPWPCQDPQQEMPVHTEFYQGGGYVHPDLAEMVGYEPPLPVSEDVDQIDNMNADIFYSPEHYPEIDENEINREAALAYQPPWVMKNIWLASPQEVGAFTPPSVGKGPCGTYTPSATPPLQLLDSPCMGGVEDGFLTPNLNDPDPAFDEFMKLTPPLERITSLQELTYRTYHAKGRQGIKPRPMHFGGYGETPSRPIPRWYGRGGQRDVIEEVEVPFSPPTPGTPPPQFPAPLGYYSPELDEFQQLEQQMEERACGRSRKRDKRRERDDVQRQMFIQDLTEQAERREMERRRAPRQPPPRTPSPPPRVPSPPPQAPMQYSPEMQDSPSYGPPPINNRELEQYMLEEMNIDPNEGQFETPPETPALMDEDMYDIFDGMSSPPPLSPEAGPCMTCGTPPAPPSPPPPPSPPQKPQWQTYADEMERNARVQEDRETRRQQLYQRNMEDIQQMFGPSQEPLSPGPDADFYANIYAHQVPPGFRQGDRPRTVVRDQIGSREINLRLPRHTAPQGLATETIIEPRVRITLPEKPRGRRPAPRPRTAPDAAAKPTPPPQVQPTSSAQRIAEARKHYQQMGRQKKVETPGGGQRRGPCQAGPAQPQPQLNLQPVEDFLRQADQQQAAPAAPCTDRPTMTPEEAQRRARERLRARKRQEDAGPPTRAPKAAPPPPQQQALAFLPPQIQRQMPRPPPQQQIQSIDDFVRRGPRPGSGTRPQSRAQPSTSGTQVRRERSAGGGCGGGSGGGCGGGRQPPRPPPPAKRGGGGGGGCCGGRK